MAGTTIPKFQKALDALKDALPETLGEASTDRQKMIQLIEQVKTPVTRMQPQKDGSRGDVHQDMHKELYNLVQSLCKAGCAQVQSWRDANPDSVSMLEDPFPHLDESKKFSRSRGETSILGSIASFLMGTRNR